MSGSFALVLSMVCIASASAASAPSRPVGFDGKRALDYTREVTQLGPRPIGTPAHARLERMITDHARKHGWEVIDDSFTANTPEGPKPVRNIIARRRGTPGGRIVAITGHYDTKIMRDQVFVGANDGGSSTGFLMEMANALAASPSRDDIYLVWFDGEEAVRQWTEADSLYGSRHLAELWSKDGTLRRIKALINVDMIGDRNLNIAFETSGAVSLRNLVWSMAAKLGYGSHFMREPNYIGDDHMPFVNRGVPAIDLIDFDYGPGNEYWHTDQDTMDKLSAESFKIVGDVVVETVKALNRMETP